MTSIDTPDRRSRKPASNRSDRQARPRRQRLALGAAFLTAPAASAQSEAGIKSDCTQGGRNYQNGGARRWNAHFRVLPYWRTR